MQTNLQIYSPPISNIKEYSLSDFYVDDLLDISNLIVSIIKKFQKAEKKSLRQAFDEVYKENPEIGALPKSIYALQYYTLKEHEND
jgi:hypothetical protein